MDTGTKGALFGAIAGALVCVVAIVAVKKNTELSVKTTTTPPSGATTPSGAFDANSYDPMRKINSPNMKPPEPGAQWLYMKIDDPMAEGGSGAVVQSANTFEFDRPYSGAQHATLMLRNDARRGNDVLLTIERGQFLCHSYSACNILVRFDDQKAQTYSGADPADHSTTLIFISNYARFFTSMQKAKTVRISTDVYQQGSPVFEFDVSGFDAAKFKSGGAKR